MEKKKKSIFKKWWFWVIVVVVVAGIGGAGGSTHDKKEDKKETVTEQTNKKDAGDAKEENNTKDRKEESDTAEEPAEEPFETNLTAGYYTAGVDIPAGTYTLTAVAGSGNVNSSNMYSGGLNEIMSAQADEYSISEFKNAKLEEGVTLNLAGTIELRLSCDCAKVSEMEARNNPLTEEVQLGSGNYVAGTDFPAGEYDVIAVDGSGNVSSSNMYDGGLNEIFSTTTDGYSISQFKNAQLEEGVELTISSCTIKLVPSK